MSTKPEPDDRFAGRPLDSPAANPFGDDEQPWFIRQVREARLDPNDNVLPMRSPIPVKADAFNWPASAGGLAQDPSPDARSSPGDADWLDWTPPPMDPVAARPQSLDLRWLRLAVLGVLAVLLAFGAGWLLRDHALQTDAAVPVAVAPTVPAPVVRPSAQRVQVPARPAVKRTVVQGTVAKPVIENAPPRSATVVAKPSAKPIKVRAKAAVVKAKARPSRPPARITKPVAAPALRRQTRVAESGPRLPRAPLESDRATVSEAPVETRTRPVERDDAAARPVAPANGAPSDLLAGVEPQAMQSDDERSMRRAARRREHEKRRVDRVLPRCVGFQVYRPNVACRVGGP